MGRLFGDMVVGIVSTVLGGLVLSLLFFIASDYIFKTPNLAGQWEFTEKVLKSDALRHKGMDVKFTVLLLQDGLRIYGTGEKISAKAKGQEEQEYEPKSRPTFEVTGYIARNYLSKDELTIHYLLKGAKRYSSTLHDLVKFNEEFMLGKYQSTIARESGTVEWRKKEMAEHSQAILEILKLDK